MTAPFPRSAGPSTPRPIRYNLSFPRAENHTIEVEAVIPTDGRARVELMLAVWTPGFYLIREYARHIESVSARSPEGNELRVEKASKNRWRLPAEGASQVVVCYRVYARDMHVAGNWVDDSFALVNGAPTFLTLSESLSRPHEISLSLPGGWSRSIAALLDAPGGRPHTYLAPDFDTLLDSPIYAGNPATYEFEVDGKKHILVNEGEDGIWEGLRSVRDVEAIVRAHRDFWGGLPYDMYVFFNLLTRNGGGLEHKDCSVLMASRWATRSRLSYLAWLNLVSHEYFHAWNAKRLRPVELGPFDYEAEA